MTILNPNSRNPFRPDSGTASNFEPSTEGTQAAQPRITLTEAARIARGNLEPPKVPIQFDGPAKTAVRFRDGMRVKVTDHGGRSDMNGLIGRVVRIKSSGHSAWVKSDTPLSIAQRRFPAGDDREDHFDIYDDECEEVPAPVAQVDAGKPECPSCGYTKEDAGFHLDHHLCKNSGNAPWETPAVAQTELLPIPDDLKRYIDGHGYGIAEYKGGGWPEDWTRSDLLALIERIASLTQRLREQEAEVDRVREEFAAWTKGSSDRMEALERSHARRLDYIRWLQQGFRDIANGTLTQIQKDDMYVRFAKDCLSGPTEAALQEIRAAAEKL